MNVTELVRDCNGQHLTVTGGDANQCTAVVHEWQRRLGLPTLWGNAVDLYANAPDDLYAKTLNQPDNFPRPGDIIVWHQDPRVGTNKYGHTAVVVYANVNTVTVFEQNDPIGATCRLHEFVNYAGVTGWIRPRLLDAAPAPVPAPAPKPAARGTVTVTAKDWLNLRSRPSSASDLATGFDAEGHPTNRLLPGVQVDFVDAVAAAPDSPYKGKFLVSIRGHYFAADFTNYAQRSLGSRLASVLSKKK